VGFGATTRSRLLLFGGLYFAQGVPWGFVTMALVLRLTGLGVGAAEVGKIVGVALLPWTLKPLLGPVVDQLSVVRWGRRRPLLLVSEAAMALSLIALALCDPRSERGLFLALVFGSSFFAALQDVLTDALAIGLLPAAERGRANGVMAAAKYGGTFVGGAGLTLLAGQIGWPGTHLAAAALLLIPATAVLLMDEPPATPAPLGAAVRALVRQIPASFVRQTTLVAALFVLVAGASDPFLYPLVVSKLRQGLGLSDSQMSLLASLAVATSVVGSLLGGWLADRLGRRGAILVGALALAASHVAFGAVGLSGTTLIAYQIGSGLSAGILYASTLALCMDLTNPALPATHFQSFMALLNVRASWASFVGGHLAEQTRPLTMFLLAAVIELLPLALLLGIDPRKAPRPALSSDGEVEKHRTG
jgi:PAT family beta-lactamase induction signal transducer AmpG